MDGLDWIEDMLYADSLEAATLHAATCYISIEEGKSRPSSDMAWYGMYVAFACPFPA